MGRAFTLHGREGREERISLIQGTYDARNTHYAYKSEEVRPINKVNKDREKKKNM